MLSETAARWDLPQHRADARDEGMKWRLDDEAEAVLCLLLEPSALAVTLVQQQFFTKN